MSAPLWLQGEAIELCRLIEGVCPEFGCHVALTGGFLYKSGARKDADILFYRIRQAEQIDRDGLFRAMEAFGVERCAAFGWLEKGLWQGRQIDFFFPETASAQDYGAAPSAPEAEEVSF